MKPISNYLEINRIAWNNKTEIHIASDFYDQTNFLKGKSSLKGIELELLGNIQVRFTPPVPFWTRQHLLATTGRSGYRCGFFR
jgi:hypothetical protein